MCICTDRNGWDESRHHRRIHFNVGSQTDKSPSSCQPFHSSTPNLKNLVIRFLLSVINPLVHASCLPPPVPDITWPPLQTQSQYFLYIIIFTLSRSQWPSQRSLISFPSTSTTTLSLSLSSSASASSPVISVSPPRDLSSFRWSRMEKLSELGSRQNN